MVHLRGMVHEGWYMVQESKLWYDYIIMVRSGNAGRPAFEALHTGLGRGKPLVLCHQIFLSAQGSNFGIIMSKHTCYAIS